MLDFFRRGSWLKTVLQLEMVEPENPDAADDEEEDDEDEDCVDDEGSLC